MDAPILRTPRLILRAHRLDDFDAALALWSDPVVARFTGGEPRSAPLVWDRLFKKSGQWTLLNYGYWLVERAADGTPIGEAGFALNKRLFDPPLQHGWPDTPEIGWAFLPPTHGQGLAFEATSACLAWIDGRGFERTSCLIESDHAASLKLAAKLGYVRSDGGGMAGRDMTILERLRPA